MLRLAALILLLGVFGQTEANRCSSRRYSESRAPPLEVRRPRICRGTGSFIGDDYWSSIGYDGQIRDGRSRADFLVFDQIGDGYVAYWITKTKYEGKHYEAFGHATVRPNGKICAQFVGYNQDIVEVCGGFRILSRNRFNPSEPIPFDWVQANPEIAARDTLGFHSHRIAKYSWEGENFYGDARIQDKHFYGVNPTSEDFVGVTEPFDFERKIWLLRRKDENRVPAPAPIRQEPPKQEETQWYKYADPHGEESIYMMNRPRQEDSVRPYAPANQDPRYYDPRYWFDRRNWQWVRGEWIYEPRNFEFFTESQETVSLVKEADPRDSRYYEPRFWYDRRNWKQVGGVWSYNPKDYQFWTEDYFMHPQNTRKGDVPPVNSRYYDLKYWYQDSRYRHPSWRDEVPQNRPEYNRDQRARLYQTSASSSSQDKTSIPGYQEQADRVAGDNDGWHVVGDSSGTAAVGEGAAPSEARRAPQTSDIQAGYYIDSYGRQVPVWDANGRPRAEAGDQKASQVGSGTHPEGQKPIVSQPGGDQNPSGHSDVQSGYYTDHYGRQVPLQGGQQVGQGVSVSNTADGSGGVQIGEGVSAHNTGDGARAADSRIGQGAGVSWGAEDTGSVGQGVRPNEQERVSFPNSQGEIGQGAQPGSHMARLHRPTVVKDEYGTVYKQTIVDGQVHYIPDPDSVQPVRPDPRLVSNPRGNLESEQWRRQQEHMRIAEEERRLQEKAIRDRWAQGRGGQETIEHVPELPPRREEPVPLEKDEEIEEEPLQIPERLPAPRPVPVEDDEDDS